MTIRVMTYNIRSLRDDRRAVGRVLASVDPDVVCIQEAPRFLFWRRSCRRLARASGLSMVAGGRNAGANVLLTRPTIEVVATRAVLFTKDRRLHQRGTSIAVLRSAGRTFAAAGTHLDGVEGPRLRHIAELHAALDEVVPPGVPTVIGVDVNDQPGSLSWRALTVQHTDAFEVAGTGDGRTSTPKEPTRRIDAVFVGPGAAASRCYVLDTEDVSRASDHRPVVVDVQLHEPRTGS